MIIGWGVGELGLVPGRLTAPLVTGLSAGGLESDVPGRLMGEVPRLLMGDDLAPSGNDGTGGACPGVGLLPFLSGMSAKLTLCRFIGLTGLVSSTSAKASRSWVLS